MWTDDLRKTLDLILIAGLNAQHSPTITLPNGTSWIYMVEIWILVSDIFSMFRSIFAAKQTHCMVCLSSTFHNSSSSQNSAFIQSLFFRVCEPQLFHFIEVCMYHLHVLLLSPGNINIFLSIVVWICMTPLRHLSCIIYEMHIATTRWLTHTQVSNRELNWYVSMCV